MADFDLLSIQFITLFQETWGKDQIPSIRKALAHVIARSSVAPSEVQQRSLLHELIGIDLHERWKRKLEKRLPNCDAWLVEDYVAQFGHILAVEKLPLKLIMREFQARVHEAHRPSLEEYAQRFPWAGESLKNKINEWIADAEKSGTIWPAIKGYEVDEKLGRGGFGTVFRAYDPLIERHVAIKVLHSADEKALTQWYHEAQAIGQLANMHNVIGVYDVSRDTKLPFIVFEYAGGGSLQDRIPSEDQCVLWDRASLRKAISELRDVASGLAAMHGKKFIHRDLTPKNILFCENGVAKLGDFGMTKLIEAKSVPTSKGYGTPAYRSPELLRREAGITSATDIYSFGVIMFRRLTGQLPFTDEHDERAADVNIPAPSLQQVNAAVGGDLDAICAKCLRKRPGERYENGTELLADLSRYLEGWIPKARSAPPWEHVWRFMIIWPWSTVFFILAVTTAATTLGLTQDRGRLTSQVADQQQELAEKEDTIEEERTKANEQSTIAQNAEERKRLHEYAADMQLIEKSWLKGDTARVLELLDRNDPEKTRLASDLRGVEWHYWNHVLRGGGVVLQDNRIPIRDVAVDPEGRYLAASDFQSVSLWDLEERKKKFEWAINARPQTRFQSQDRSFFADDSVVFSPDGKYLAATGFVVGRQKRFGALRVWEIPGGREVLAVTDDPTISGRAVAFSPDGTSVVVGGYRNGWRSWDIESAEEGTEAKGERVPGLLVGPNFGGGGGEQRSRVRVEGSSTTSDLEIVRTLRFSLDGGQLWTSCFRRLPVPWNWRDGKLVIHELNGRHPATEFGMTFPAESAGGFFSVDDGAVHLHVSRRQGPFPEPAQSERLSLNWTSFVECCDYRRGMLVVGDRDRAVSVWITENGKLHDAPIAVHRGHGANLSCVSLTEQGIAVSADKKGTIRVWSREKPSRLRFNSMGGTIQVAADSLGRVIITDIDGQVAGQITLEEGESLGWCGVSPNERYIAISLRQANRRKRHRFVVWDMPRRRVLFSHGYGSKLLDSATSVFNADSTRVAAVTGGDQVTVWSLEDGSQVEKIPISDVFRLAMDRNGQQIAVKQDKSLSVWSVALHKKLCELPVDNAARGSLLTFAFSADGTKLVVDGPPDTVWDVASGKAIPLPQSDADGVQRMAGEVRPRLYRITGDTLEIGCGRTLQRLAGLPVKWEDFHGDTLFAFSPVAGTNGFLESKTLDRLLETLGEEWKASNGQ